jgi:hypothetical protein
MSHIPAAALSDLDFGLQYQSTCVRMVPALAVHIPMRYASSHLHTPDEVIRTGWSANPILAPSYVGRPLHDGYEKSTKIPGCMRGARLYEPLSHR